MQSPSFNESLTDLARRFGSDKGMTGPNETWVGHGYTDVYEAYFWPWREQPINLLEIGIGIRGEGRRGRIAQGVNQGGGASLKMWYEYFPSAQIYGIDITPGSHIDNDRITTFCADQGDVHALEKVVETAGYPSLDIIIDDGSHQAPHQQISLAFLWKLLKPGGLYVIEDLLSNGQGDYEGSFGYSPEVLNTRKILQRFCESGHFPLPHALGESSEQIAQDVDWIHFHVPPLIVHQEVKFSRHPFRSSVQRKVGSEQMCVLRKRS